MGSKAEYEERRPDRRWDDRVACAFWNRTDGLIEPDIRIPTGSSARSMRLRTACLDFAQDSGSRLWVMPNLEPVPLPGKPWLLFQCDSRWRNADFLQGMPSMAAAEMWMIHHGHKY